VIGLGKDGSNGSRIKIPGGSKKSIDLENEGKMLERAGVHREERPGGRDGDAER